MPKLKRVIMSANSNPKATFKTVLLQSGKTATGIKIPPEIIEKLGAGKKPPVKVTINGFTYRSTVAVMGGNFMVGVNAENRSSANVKGGDKLEVTIELDTEPRTVELPAELQKVFEKNKAAKAAFDKLAPSKKKAMALSITEAKTEETKTRRIEKIIASLVQ
jgi:hypothetical protein